MKKFSGLCILPLMGAVLLTAPAFAAQQPSATAEQQRLNHLRQDRQIQDQKLEEQHLDNKQQEENLQDRKLQDQQLENRQQDQKINDRQFENKRIEQRRIDNQRRI